MGTRYTVTGRAGATPGHLGGTDPAVAGGVRTTAGHR